MHRKLHSILLVDDNFLTNTYNEKIIEDLAVANHVITAENAEEAFDYMERCRKNNTYPELILLDLRLPDMNGYDFIKKMRELHFDKTHSPAVVILTSSTDAEDERRSFSTPEVIGFLNKPLSAKHFLDMLQLYYMSEMYSA
jgi:CheY-like chemotaxis protein